MSEINNDSYPEDILRLGQSDRGLLERIVTDRLALGESIDDVFSGAAFLVRRRAELLGHDPGADDFVYILSLFTWYPFKPDLPSSAEAQLVQSRTDIFRGAANGEFGRLEYIPGQILTLSFLELTMRQLGDPNEYLAALGLLGMA